MEDVKKFLDKKYKMNGSMRGREWGCSIKGKVYKIA